MNILSILICSFLFFSANTVNSAEFDQIINTNEQFSMRLPTGWQQIPNSVLEEYKESVRLSTSDGKIPNYSYAFQKIDKKGNYFEGPYILVRVINAHMSKTDIEKLTNTKLDEKSLNEIKNNLPNIVSNINLGTYVYDTDGNVIWNKSRASVDGEYVIALTALKVTKTKTICIYCSSLESDFIKYSQAFEDFVKLIKLDNSIKN